MVQVVHADVEHCLVKNFTVFHVGKNLGALFRLVALGENGGQRCGDDVVRRGDRDADAGGHAGDDGRVAGQQLDACGEALDAVPDGRLWRYPLDDAIDDEVGDGLNLYFHLLFLAHARHVRLVDMRLDDEVVQVGNLHHLGAGTLASRAGYRLADRHRPGQHGAVEGGEDAGFRKLLECELIIILGAIARNEGLLVIGLGSFKDFRGNQLLLEKLLGTLKLTLGLLQLKRGAVDLLFAGINFDLEILVVQAEKQVALGHAVGDVHRQLGDLAVNLRPYGNLVRRADFTRHAHREIDVAVFDDFGCFSVFKLCFVAVGLFLALPLEVAKNSQCHNQRNDNDVFHK